MITISMTLSVQIACPVEEAYRFIADPATMPQWASTMSNRSGLWDKTSGRFKHLAMPEG
jgi:uncharacterized protein YndB with AHSA1/START domain